MKSLILLFFFSISNISFAQGLIFNTITENPKVLMLEKISSWNGENYLSHVEEEPLTHVRVKFIGEQLLKLQSHLLKSESPRIFCDGNFSLEYDRQGSQFIALSAVNVCIDEGGWVVAHSIGKQLSPSEVQMKAGELSLSINKKETNKAIYQGDSIKDVPYNFSSGTQRSGQATHQ